MQRLIRTLNGKILHFKCSSAVTQTNKKSQRSLRLAMNFQLQILTCLVMWLSLAAAEAVGHLVTGMPPLRTTAHNTTALQANCGKLGEAACSQICTTGEQDFVTITPEATPCPAYKLSSSGCKPGLTRVVVTPDLNWMPDVCLQLPQMGRSCGAKGQACCLTANAAERPQDNIRAQCSKGLTCIVHNMASIPYGSSKHMQRILTTGKPTAALTSKGIMGSCEKLELASSVRPLTRESQGHTAKITRWHGLRSARLMAFSHHDPMYKPCDYAHACVQGSYCAGNEDHYLGGTRCLPLPPCGGPYQPCCPPNANGHFNHEYSILTSTSSPGSPAAHQQQQQQTPMPYCRDPGSTCLWEPSTVDVSQPHPQNDLQPRPPQPSYSMSVTFPLATCIPGLKQCGQAGQPCCPHAQFAVSNTKMFFRTHVCDAGLSCNATMDLSVMPPVFGVCQGAAQRCGLPGQKCCEHTDAAGWTWQTCLAGQPGVYCSKVHGVCRACPGRDRRMSAVEAAEVGEAC